jgi:hypothetical protein
VFEQFAGVSPADELGTPRCADDGGDHDPVGVEPVVLDRRVPPDRPDDLILPPFDRDETGVRFRAGWGDDLAEHVTERPVERVVPGSAAAPISRPSGRARAAIPIPGTACLDSVPGRADDGDAGSDGGAADEALNGRKGERPRASPGATADIEAAAHQ